MNEFDPVSEAASWPRPYTSVQWAWVRALHVEPSATWREGRRRTRRADGNRRDMREAMRQRHGVRGL